MIVDTALFNETSQGSGQGILCRCDGCGQERKVPKQKLVLRGGSYTHCRQCFCNKNSVKSRSYIDVDCKDCGLSFKKRLDSVKTWAGRCSNCALKEAVNRPHVKEAMRLNGIAVYAKYGPLRFDPEKVRRGPMNNKWKGGITSENMKVRTSLKTKAWRSDVLSRDDYTCQMCDKRGGDLEVDHIMPFSLHMESRFATFNGRTLCKPCHRMYGAKVSHGVQTREPVFREEISS
jgi:5-methylcytosine-specific restriction endonuclease McrA